jgi:hypothetical protein
VSRGYRLQNTVFTSGTETKESNQRTQDTDSANLVVEKRARTSCYDIAAMPSPYPKT